MDVVQRFRLWAVVLLVLTACTNTATDDSSGTTVERRTSTAVPTVTVPPVASVTGAEAPASARTIGSELTQEQAAEAELLRVTFETHAAEVVEDAGVPLERVELETLTQVENGVSDILVYTINDNALLAAVPGSSSPNPTAVAIMFNPESATSLSIITTALLMVEKSHEWYYYFQNVQRPESGMHQLELHVANFYPLEPTSTGLDWVFTLTPKGSSNIGSALLQALLTTSGRTTLVASTWSTAAERAAFDDFGDSTTNKHHLPVQLGDVEFGMTLSDFTAATGIPTVPEELLDRTIVTEEFDEGNLRSATYHFYTPDHTLYEVILEYDAAPEMVEALAYRMFGPTDPAIPNLRSRARGVLRWGLPPTAEWLLPLESDYDIWANTFNSTIELVATEPGNGYDFISINDY